MEEAVTKMTEAKASLRDVEEQLAAAIEVLNRTIIRVLTDGIVVTSAYNIAGNVIASGRKNHGDPADNEPAVGGGSVETYGH